ncbi:MAG TPA: hypothetical protein VN426_07940 [Syntrophomonadaceae bacterium]|nr:hypothetical protein [Syntrophomonadaceae bacterium]
MKCPVCYHEIQEDSNVCSFCGLSVEDALEVNNFNDDTPQKSLNGNNAKTFVYSDTSSKIPLESSNRNTFVGAWHCSK